MSEYIVIEVDGLIRSPISRKGQADKYSQPKLFGPRKEAQEWIDKHTYKGMSWRYEIGEVKL